MNVTVVGIGAMGGGMARALLKSSVTNQIVGYDRATSLVDAFYQESKESEKEATGGPPQKLSDAVGPATNFVILALVNEAQFTATFVRRANDRFRSKGIYFVDCPISGGPVRAGKGELTMMASGDDASLEMSRSLLDVLGSDIHIVAGGAGMSSTVKMVHQLLAGVHICCAAEALALAAKAGLDVEQMYRIVNGAAGASWMFTDRGKRMIAHEEPDVMSALNIFVKDLDIVYSEAKALQSPIPVASAALQQFISGQSMGYGTKDDSQVVKVYEKVTGARVGQKDATTKEGDNVGDIWQMPDGSEEVILEVGDEPRHNVVISNEYVRALRAVFPPNDTTLAHRHEEDSIYYFLTEGRANVVNHVKGSDPDCDYIEFGEVRYGAHKTDKPLVHTISNKSDKVLLCIDAEVLKQPPVVAAIPLVAEHHELIKTRDKCRVYKLSLAPGETVKVSYPFFYFVVVLTASKIKTEIGDGAHGISWEETKNLGDVEWKEPAVDVQLTNVGETVYSAYISEWR